MIIRKETEKDFSEIREVIKLAFENAEHSDKNEHNLAEKLRSSKAFVKELALVAEAENKIIGHIMFTKIKVGKDKGLALAPLSVHPNAQRKGVGKLLIEKGHNIANDLGYS